MTKIKTYLTFNGNCREAMQFYCQCLGGELTLQTIEESPLAEKMPASMKDLILHASLKRGDMEILASDMVAEEGLIKGNAVSLMLDCSTEEDIKAAYISLSEGGKATHELELTFFGALFGDLVDRYGNHWLLHFDINQV